MTYDAAASGAYDLGDLISADDSTVGWTKGAGAMTKGRISIDSLYGPAGNFKNYGVFGQGTSASLGYEYRDSEYYMVTNYDYTAEEAYAYGQALCMPTFVAVNVYLASGSSASSTISDTTSPLTLGFRSNAGEAKNLWAPSVDDSNALSQYDDLEDLMDTYEAYDTYYQQNGAMDLHVYGAMVAGLIGLALY